MLHTFSLLIPFNDHFFLLIIISHSFINDHFLGCQQSSLSISLVSRIDVFQKNSSNCNYCKYIVGVFILIFPRMLNDDGGWRMADGGWRMSVGWGNSFADKTL